jgi:hypothetical protein
MVETQAAVDYCIMPANESWVQPNLVWKDDAIRLVRSHESVTIRHSQIVHAKANV